MEYKKKNEVRSGGLTNKFVFVIALIAALELFSANQVQAQRLTWGAAPARSPYYAFSVGFSNAVHNANNSIEFTLTETQGAVDITNRIRRKQVDLGIANFATDYQNFFGGGAFKGTNQNARILFYLNRAAMQWIVRADSDVHKLSDLNGKSFNPGGAGTTAAKQSESVFKLFGIKPNWYQGGISDAGKAMQNRQVVGLTKIGPLPDSFIQQVAVSTKIRLLGLSTQEVQLIEQKLPTFAIVDVPANTYDGQTAGIRTAGALLGVQADTRLSEEIAYKIAKVAFEKRDTWEQSFPAAKNFNQIELTLSSKIPLHAGIVRYLKEKGHEVPEKLIPPEYK